jgi:hypothetical protein
MSKKQKWVADVVMLHETKAILYKIPFTINPSQDSLLTTYHNIPTNNISSQQWVEVNVKQCQTLMDILRFCHKARRNGKTHLKEKEETKENPKRKAKKWNTQNRREEENRQKKGEF